MKINEIKVNNYGKIKNKDIYLNNINIIYGKNEAGKSTLLNFIINILYGIQKTKNGKDKSDYDKYKPWIGEDFSGKINYELDDGNKYDVFRDFNKKNPEIYDENYTEISNKFTIDKRNGSQFFYDQTKIDRDTLISTVVVPQEQVKVDDITQNILIQKIANLAESGNEEVSYKKAIGKLDKCLLNEVGTDKSQDRPINIARKNINIYENKIDEIKEAKIFKYKIEEDNKKIKDEIEKENNNKIIYSEINEILNNNNIENEKIKIKNKIIAENNTKIEKNKIEKNKIIKKINKKFNIIFIIILMFINLINFIFIKNLLLNCLGMLFTTIFVIYLILKNKKNNYKYLDTQNSILEKNNYELNKDIELLIENLKKNNEESKQNLIKKYGNDIQDLFNSNINIAINNNNEKLNTLNLQLHKLELDRQNIDPKLEELSETEELLEAEKENLKDLEDASLNYIKAKEILQLAYEEMRKNVTPRFNESLSTNISKFSNQKYQDVSLNNGIFVKLENEKYISVEDLSVGTIEQIYLSLRLSVIEEISAEKLPIILDEAFAYYDIERLTAALKFLYESGHQIIIFSCSEREQKIMEQNNLKYNLIEI